VKIKASIKISTSLNIRPIQLLGLIMLLALLVYLAREWAMNRKDGGDSMPVVSQGDGDDSMPVVGQAGDIDFSFAVAGYHPCPGWDRYVEFQVINLGTVAFESAFTGIRAKNGNWYIFKPGENDAPFTEKGACPLGSQALGPNEMAYIAYNVSNAIMETEAEATMKLCTGDHLQGRCVTHTLSFTIPAPE
jgi:hypothetical protein